MPDEKTKADQIAEALLKHRQLALDVHEKLASRILRVWNKIIMTSSSESTKGMQSVEYTRGDCTFTTRATVSFAPWRKKPFANIKGDLWSHEYEPETPPEKIMTEVDAKLMEMGFIVIEGPLEVTDYTDKE
jgi:hypothetical protein